jgi:hypothetical protein
VSQIFAERKLNLLSNAQYFLITATHQHILWNGSNIFWKRSQPFTSI